MSYATTREGNCIAVRKYRANNLEKVRKIGRDCARDWRFRNRVRHAEDKWRQQGIRSAVWFDKFLKWPEFVAKIYEQQGVCWGCGKLLEMRDGLRNCGADHCHTTGLFRHVLCQRCNFIEGAAASELGRLFQQDSAAFIEQHSW